MFCIKFLSVSLLISISLICFGNSQNIGDSCTIPSECTLPHSICLNEICQCNENSFSSPDGLSCLPFANRIWDPCEIIQQCMTLAKGNLSSVFCDNGFCSCSTDYVQSTGNDTCLPKRDNLEDDCLDDKQCGLENSFCIRQNQNAGGRCLCGSDFVKVTREETSQCEPIQRVGNGTCNYDEQCQAQFGSASLCDRIPVDPPYEGVCRCYAFYGAIFIPADNRCYATRALGETCSSNYECTYGINKYAFCNPESGKCECQPGAIPSPFADRWCYGNKTIGDDCTNVIGDCSLFIDGNVDCDAESSKCSCGGNQIPTPGGRQCINPPSKLGDMCIFSAGGPDQCVDIISNSFCNRQIGSSYRDLGFCDCEYGYFKNFTGITNEYECAINPKLIGDWCTDSGQCQSISRYAYCQESFSNLGRKRLCTCIDNTEPNENSTGCVTSSTESTTIGQCSTQRSIAATVMESSRTILFSGLFLMIYSLFKSL